MKINVNIEKSNNDNGHSNGVEKNGQKLKFDINSTNCKNINYKTTNKNDKEQLKSNSKLNKYNDEKNNSLMTKHSRHSKYYSSIEKGDLKKYSNNNYENNDSNNHKHIHRSHKSDNKAHIRIRSSPFEYNSSSFTSISSPVKLQLVYNDEGLYEISGRIKMKNDKCIDNKDNNNKITTEGNSNNLLDFNNPLSTDSITKMSTNSNGDDKILNNINNSITNISNSDNYGNNKNIEGINNSKEYHTKCPNCFTSFDVLPNTNLNENNLNNKNENDNTNVNTKVNERNDSVSTLSSHSSLTELIDKVVESKNRKKNNNLSLDSLESLPEALLKKIDKITQKKHFLKKSSHVHSSSAKEEKGNNSKLSIHDRKGKSNTSSSQINSKMNNDLSNKNNINSNNNILVSSTVLTQDGETKTKTLSTSGYSHQKNRSSVMTLSKNSNLRSNPRIFNSMNRSLNKNLNSNGSAQRKSNSLLNSVKTLEGVEKSYVPLKGNSSVTIHGTNLSVKDNNNNNNNKSEVISNVTSMAHLNMSCHSADRPTDKIASNKKDELEIDNISVYPVPFGSKKLYNVPILPINDKYEFDDHKENNVANNSENNQNKEDNAVNYEQELNDLGHDLTSSFDSELSDAFLLNELPDNVGSKTKLNNPKAPIEKENPNNEDLKIGTSVGNSKTSLIHKDAESSCCGSMNPITAQLLQAARQGAANSKTNNDTDNDNNSKKENNHSSLGSKISLVSKSISTKGSMNKLYQKVLSGSLNSFHSGIVNKGNNSRKSHSNLRNVTTLNYSVSSKDGEDKDRENNKDDTFKLPSINEIFNSISDNVVTFVKNQWNQKDGISTTFEFLNVIKNTTTIDNSCNDYLMKPLIEYNDNFVYISPSWLNQDEVELNKIQSDLQAMKEKRFFVMPWKIEEPSINEGNPYWICVIYDNFNKKYMIFDSKNEDIYVYGECLMIQSSIIKYMMDITIPFYSKTLQEIITNKEQGPLEIDKNDEGWKNIIICNAGLNHGDCGIDNVLLSNYYVQNYEKVFNDIVQNNMEYNSIKELLSTVKFAEFNSYIESLFTIAAVQYFNINNMLI
ncbi:hypothetical protein LY90DRAFT_502901 [Neocallimastix californiae]|uniref:Ubiquitin-like protease family profile domain-containing protein n=1 Tax=Neocallimastix californiae TaxID=1754190 RepID=A0A1Y2EQA5_9FUNG|nr:hypothetical protein LY90DRAFT_502901 [Neocallimastix californiae]|eukprot:ORY73717.1 hypothetical protein LY90DRAFT_502901 [Neocallimastix californiae]